MNDLELKKLWQTLNDKFELSLAENRSLTKELSNMKVYNFISSMKPLKIFTILAGIIWVILGAIIVSNIFLNAYTEASKFFLYSAAIQILLTAIALVIYIYQLVTIYRINITEPVLKTQEKLAALKTSTLISARILFLQLPVWTTFYLNENMLENGSPVLLIIQGIVTISFTIAAVWLFFNIRFENKDKKWFRMIFNGNEWTPLMRSMELLKLTEDYKLEK
ncbi:MAG: hypothetical protein IPM96_06290 [Ignavibacteria bacterium]|nr:hypothetical protein [Ignavibacteria bacterium]